MPILTFTKSGVKSQTQTKLNQSVFGIKDINHSLLKQAYDAYLANGRVNLAATKTRGEVQGSNKKPWKQKGTGRARVGSKRTPLWRGGGIVFGPTGNENYTKKINIKAKRNALKHALSAANLDKQIYIIEELSITKPKTSQISSLLEKIGLPGYTLIVTDTINNELLKASQNLADVKVIQAMYLNVPRIMDADSLLITKSALKVIDNWLVGTKTKDVE